MTAPPLYPPTTANAVDREAAWLATSGDGLPALLRSAGGPFDVVQGYLPRTPAQSQASLFLRRTRISDDRWSNQLKRARYSFSVRAEWRIGTTTAGLGIGEAEQRAFDAAIELVIQRIRGTLADHSHGGAFLSVAEAPSPASIDVSFVDPDTTMSTRALRADITYFADDQLVVI